MTLTELDTKLDYLLRKRLEDKKHVITGNLKRSVMFECQLTDNELKVRFKSLFYMKFLEHGDFIYEFFQLQSTRDPIDEFMRDFILNNI